MFVNKLAHGQVKIVNVQENSYTLVSLQYLSINVSTLIPKRLAANPLVFPPSQAPDNLPNSFSIVCSFGTSYCIIWGQADWGNSFCPLAPLHYTHYLPGSALFLSTWKGPATVLSVAT